MGREFRNRDESFAFLTMRRDADIYLLVIKDEMLHDDGELYILDEVYGKFIAYS